MLLGRGALCGVAGVAAAAGETVLGVTFWARETGVFVFFFAGPVDVTCFLLEPKLAGTGDVVAVTKLAGVGDVMVVTVDGLVTETEVSTVDGLVAETEVLVFYKQDRRWVYVSS